MCIAYIVAIDIDVSKRKELLTDFLLTPFALQCSTAYESASVIMFHEKNAKSNKLDIRSIFYLTSCKTLVIFES